MAIVLKDRVKVSFTTEGTGDFTPGVAILGYQDFAIIGEGNSTYYCAFDPMTGDWEVGYGIYSNTGPTLTRDFVLSSSNAGAKVSFTAGSKELFVTYPAEKAIYEEETGNVLIDGGPITVVGSGVTGYNSFTAVLGEMYGNVDSFAQFYAQNYSDGTNASGDFVVYRNDATDDTSKFVDMGINSSLYNSLDYPIFSGGSAYLFNDGGELFVGSATDDLIFFAGGVDTTDEAARFDKTTKALTTAGAVNIGDGLGVTGAAVFNSTVLLSADPTLALQAATKQYVDNAVSTGFHLHTAVQVATTGNLNATYNNGSSGVGATLTNAGSQAALVVDGVSVVVNNRVLVWQQSAPAQNGVYVVTTVGSGSTNWVLTRSSDTNNYAPESDTGLGGGDYFFVESGATLGYSSYVCTNDGAIVFGTTAITFQLFSTVPAYNVTAPLALVGNTLSLSGVVAATNGGTGTGTVTKGDLLYGSATDTWSKLALGAQYKLLVSDSSGTPQWGAVALNQADAVSGALATSNGGTGLTAYALGDLIYSDATNSLARLAGNTSTTKLFLYQTGTGSTSAPPAWGQPAASDITGLAPSATTDTTNASNISSGTLGTARLNGSYTGITGVGTLTAGTWNGSTIGPTYGGTGFASYAVGDLLYADTTTSLAKLADVAVGNALISGGVGVAPSWGKIGMATHVTGTLPIANGGTNATATPTAGAIAFGTGTAYNFTSAGTSGQVLTSAGASTPTWTTATDANTASAIVKRDASGNFSAGTITASLTGNVTGNVTGNLTGNATTATSATSATSATTAASSPLLSTLSNYVWTASSLPTTYNAGIQSSFVSGTEGWQSYGSVITTRTYSSGGGSLQMYVPYSPTYGGTGLQMRFGNYDVSSGNAWTSWKTVLASDNYTTYTGPVLNNTSSSYGGVATNTTRGGYYGYLMGTTTSHLNAMADTSGNGGFYREASGVWPLYYNVGNACVGINGSGTASGYGCYVSGALYSTGNVVSYSDERVKTNWRPLPDDFLEQLANMKYGVYDRTDIEATQVGVSAQSLKSFLPSATMADDDGNLSVVYGNAALVASAELSKRVIDQDKRIAQLEALVAKLIQGASK